MMIRINYKNKNINNEDGIAIIIVLGLLSILAALVAVYLVTSRFESKVSQNLFMTMQAKLLSEAGANYSASALRHDKFIDMGYVNTQYDSLEEGWATGYYNGAVKGETGLTFDTRYTTTQGTSQLNETSGGRVLRGIVDEERKININYATSGMLTSLCSTTTIRDAILAGQPNWLTVTQILSSANIGKVDLYGEDTNNNFTLDTNEADGAATLPNDNGDSVLDGGLIDYITVSSGTTAPVNVNTAPYKVLVAVLNSGDFTGTPDFTGVAKAIVEYRTGKDYDDGVTPVGDGNANPFDGLDTNRNDLLDPTVDFGLDGLDNDGDGVIDGADVDENYLFTGGAYGEFNALIYLLESSGYNGSGAIINSSQRDEIIDNADPTVGITYSVPFIFESNVFQVISTGEVLDPNGDVAANSTLVRIINR